MRKTAKAHFCIIFLFFGGIFLVYYFREYLFGFIAILWAFGLMRNTAGEEGRMKKFTDTNYYKKSKDNEGNPTN